MTNGFICFWVKMFFSIYWSESHITFFFEKHVIQLLYLILFFYLVTHIPIKQVELKKEKKRKEEPSETS